MTAADRNASKPRPRWRRWARTLGCLGLVLVLSCALLYALRDAWAPRALRWIVARSTPYELELEAVRGDLWSWIALDGVVLSARDAHAPLQSVRAAHVELEYDLRALARDPLTGCTRIRVQGAQVAADLTRAAAASSAAHGSRSAPLARLPRIELADIDLVCRLPGGAQLALSGLSAHTRAAAIELAIPAATYSGGGETLSASLDAEIAYAGGRIDVARLSFRSPLARGHLRASLVDGRVRSTVHVEDLDLPRALELAGEPLAGLVARLDLDGELALPLSAPETFTGAVFASARELSFDGRSVEWAEGSFAATEDEYQATHVRLIDAADRAQLDDVHLARSSEPGCEAWEQLHGRFELELAALDARVRQWTGMPALPAGARRDAPEAGLPAATHAHARGTLAQGELEGDVELADLDLPAVWSWFADIDADTPRATIDARGHVRMPLDAPARTTTSAQLQARDLAFAGRRLEFLRGAFELSNTHYLLHHVSAVGEPNTIEIPLLSIARDGLPECPLWYRTRAAFEARIADLPALLRGALTGLDEAALPRHELALRGSYEPGALELESGSFAIESGRLLVEHGRIPIPPRIDELFAQPGIEIALQARFQDLTPLSTILSTPPWEGALEAEVDVRGAWRALTGRAQVRGTHVRFAGLPLGEIELSADVDANVLRVERLRIDGEAGQVLLHGSYGFAERLLELGGVDAHLPDLRLVAPETLPHGAIDVQGHAHGSWPALAGELRLEAHDLTLLGETLELVRLRSRFADRTFRVDTLEAHAARGDVRARGAFEISADRAQTRIALDELAWTRGAQDLELVRPVQATFARGAISIEGLELEGSAGALRATLAFDPQGGSIDAHLFDLSPPAFLPALAYPGLALSNVDADVVARWSAEDVDVRARGKVEGLRLEHQTTEYTLAFQMALADGMARIDELRLGTATQNVLELSGEAPFALRGDELLADGPLTLRGHAQFSDLELARALPAFAGRDVRGALSVGLDLTGSWTSALGAIDFAGTELSIARERGETRLGPGNASGRLRAGAQAIELENVRIDAPGDVEVALTGRVAAPLDLRALLARGLSRFDDAPLSLSARLDDFDLAGLPHVLPMLRRAGGRARGALSIGGTLKEPSFSGDLRVKQGEVRIASTLPSITGVGADLELIDNVVHIAAIEGRMGGAPFHLEGSIALGATGETHLTLRGENLLLYREAGVTLRADAELEIDGPPHALLIHGKLATRDSRFARNLDFMRLAHQSGGAEAPTRGLQLFSLRDSPFADVRFDIEVGSVKPFVITTNMARGSLRPALRLIGTGSQPILRGTIYVDPTRVSIPTGPIRVQSGAIEFLPSDPYVPVLELRALARMQGYDITLRVHGPYDEPIVDLSSVPPLAREDLMLLVLTGRPPNERSSLHTGERAAQDVAVYLANDVVSRWFSGNSEDSAESLAERIEIYSGADVTRKGADTTQLRFKLSPPGWLRDNDVYLTGERDVYDHYNYGLRLVFRFP